MSNPTNFKCLLRKIGQIHNTATADHVSVIQRSLKTVKEMLTDRGCDEIKLLCKTFNEIEECIKNGNHIMQADSKTHQTRVYICNDEKVGVKQLRAWCEQNDPTTCLIILSIEGCTSFAKRETENTSNVIQFFSFRDMSVNITKHVLVPRHKKINHLPVIDGFEIDRNDLPKLNVNDKISLYYGLKIGDIVEITRFCGSQQPQKYWRLVEHVTM